MAIRFLTCGRPLKQLYYHEDITNPQNYCSKPLTHHGNCQFDVDSMKAMRRLAIEHAGYNPKVSPIGFNEMGLPRVSIEKYRMIDANQH